MHVTLLGPSTAGTLKEMFEVVSQTPLFVEVCTTLLFRFATFHIKTGGCVGHVCVTEQATVITDPASASIGTLVITGFSGEAK